MRRSHGGSRLICGLQGRLASSFCEPVTHLSPFGPSGPTYTCVAHGGCVTSILDFHQEIREMPKSQIAHRDGTVRVGIGACDEYVARSWSQ